MEIRQVLGRLEEGMNWVKTDLSHLRKTQETQGKDIKILLSWRWKIYGASAVLGLVGAGLFQLFMAIFFHGK